MAHPVATADCIAWYRGDSLVDGGGGVASSWQDKSGNGYHLTASNNPTIASSGLNGRLAARFVSASSQSFSRASAPALSQPFTVAVVAKIANFTGDPNLLASNTTTEAYGFFYFDTDNTLSYYAGSNVFGGAITPNAWYLHAALMDDDASEIFLDNTRIADSAAGATNPGNNGFTGIRVSASPFGAGFVQGDIAEAVIWDKVLSGAELDALFAYYQDYYFGSAARAFGTVMG